MKLNHFIYLLFLGFFHLSVKAQIEFDGQLLGQTNFGFEKKSPKSFGSRYLPSLTFKKKWTACPLLQFRFQEILVLLNF